MTDYILTRHALADIDEIVATIATDSLTTAHAFERSAYTAFDLIVSRPGIGHRRTDLTDRDVFFWTIMKSFAVIYRKTTPVEIVRVVRWRRDIATLNLDPD